ncbi:TRAP transporter large permease subunit [Desulfosarcina cetonica]|uniref:TRAP transporter large permease subunit n=1 Tax=Desulfosarcina cetonica TaxID=90730 RepID=UPI0006D163A9|nr:TRAP transporter large permease subunit [Desulfosarcina cetonica]
MESIIMLAILFGLLLLRIPIYICLYFTGVLGLLIFTDMEFIFVAQTVLQKIDNFSLICIPFFIFMGSVMVRGQSATRLVEFAWKFVSWLPGGLGITSVISSGVFGAISGSAISTVVTIGGVIFPHMDKYKYPKAFSVGLVTAASILGIIIPPSIIMIICALTAGESVVRLFAAGYLPGGLIMLMLSLYAWWESHRKGLGREALERFDFKGLLIAGKNAFFAVLIIAVLFGGIYSGAFTVTEASVVACVLVLIVEMAIYRAVNLVDLKELLISTGVVSGAW